MSALDPARATATEIALAVRRRQLSATEVFEALAARIERQTEGVFLNARTPLAGERSSACLQ